MIRFIYRDYDFLWERMKAFSPKFFIAWRDCGLVDGSGTPPPAYPVWKERFEPPLRP